MAFNVNYDDLLTMQCTACNKISDWSEICSELKEAITDFINTSELQGQGMDSIRNYLSIKLHFTT